MDPFQRLPWFVLRAIFASLPDLSSLYSLHIASPAVASFLYQDEAFSVICEDIISQNEYGSGLLWESQALIRVIVRLWCRQVPGFEGPDVQITKLLARHWDIFVYPTIQRSAGFHPLSGGPLSRETPPDILCRLLAVSTRVRQLSHACLHDFMIKCNALQPKHLLDSGFQYQIGSSHCPEGQAYQPVDIGPPSWIEEQRMIRAIWRLVLSFELKDIYRLRPLYELCGREKWQRRNQEAREFWDDYLSYGEHEELVAVSTWLSGLDFDPGDGQLLPWMDSSSKSWDEKMSWRSYRPMAEEELMNEQWDLQRKRSAGYHFWLKIRHSENSPLRHSDFAFFHQYGFPFWDHKRMAALGFLPCQDSSQPQQLSTSNLFFTWQSILTQEELEKVRGKQKYPSTWRSR